MMGMQVNLRKNLTFLAQRTAVIARSKSTAGAAQNQPKRNAVSVKSIESMGKSLACKGFLRPIKSYKAEANVADKVQLICGSLQIPSAKEHKLTNLEEKFKFLEACFRDFKHSVPNSQIHELQTVGDVIEFYECSVDTTVPYDALKKLDLPENLHIQYDYVRFHPETDAKFNGQTAFPKSSTLVTGLKYRNKYQGHEAKRSWP